MNDAYGATREAQDAWAFGETQQGAPAIYNALNNPMGPRKPILFGLWQGARWEDVRYQPQSMPDLFQNEVQKIGRTEK